MTLGIRRHVARAEQIIAEVGGTTYASDFQVTYKDEAALVDSLAQLTERSEGVTTPKDIAKLSSDLAAIALGEDTRLILITGNCSEAVVDPIAARVPTEEAIAGIDLIAQSTLGKNVLHIRRDRGQNTKPRSESHESRDGRRIQSYMGDAINSIDENDREPSPHRLVDASLQALQLENNLTEHYGTHVFAAHEALNLYFEQAWIREADDGRRVLLSADLPWIGVRTNGARSMQVDLLAGVENSIGVKIGSSTTPEHMTQLQEKLNPTRKIGKLAWMLRVGLDHPAILRQIVTSLVASEQAPVILYDIHGSTVKREDGAKIRSVERIQQEIEQLYDICESEGAKLHGLHLETTVKNRVECVDLPHQTPLHEGGIDPQLNKEQLLRVVDGFARLNQ